MPNLFMMEVLRYSDAGEREINGPGSNPKLGKVLTSYGVLDNGAYRPCSGTESKQIARQYLRKA